MLSHLKLLDMKNIWYEDYENEKAVSNTEHPAPALKISWGPPSANFWPNWSPQKRVNRDKLDQR